MTTQYWIAQHVTDLFRNEPRNVGVIVSVDGVLAARFLGESDANTTQLDGRKLKHFTHPDVYRQWVAYWRGLLRKNDSESLAQSSGSHYRILEAGNVTDCEDDSPIDVANYLYALLVSEGGLTEALALEEASTEISALSIESELTDALRQRHILGNDSDQHVPHPIKRGVPVRGHRVTHTPAFVQENGRLYVMETIDFTNRQKKNSRDHAGWSAYMFRDIRDERKDYSPIAVVRMKPEDQDIDDVKNGLSLLKNEAEIVDWLDPQKRDAFLEACKNVAITT